MKDRETLKVGGEREKKLQALVTAAEVMRDLSTARAKSGALDIKQSEAQKELQAVKSDFQVREEECNRLARDNKRLRDNVIDAEKKAEKATLSAGTTIAIMEKDVRRATRKYDMELKRNAKMSETLEKVKKLNVEERKKVSALHQVDDLTRCPCFAS
jgi:hypothetical protein